MNTIEKIRALNPIDINVSKILDAIKQMKKVGVISDDSEIQFTDGKETYIVDVIGADKCDCCDKKIFKLFGKKL
jgi:hypothetical protein